MAQPTGQTSSIVLLGKSGAGKSTVGNLLLYGVDDAEDGFGVSDDPQAMTTECKTISVENDGCTLQVTDTPGVPDTDQTESLKGYDKIVKHVRSASALSALIIMVKSERAEDRDYVNWRSLLRQFNMLPCPKIMVCRVSLNNCSEDRKKKKDEGAHKLMDNIVTKAELTFVWKRILHDMDGEEVKSLRDQVHAMPCMAVRSIPLRTYVEIKDAFEKLSNSNDRMNALDVELSRLRKEKDLHDLQRSNYTKEIDSITKKRGKAGATSTALAAGAAAADVVFGGLASLVVGAPAAVAGAIRVSHMSGKLSDLRIALEAAEERIKILEKDISCKQDERRSGNVNQAELQKAHEEFLELEALSE